MATPVKTLVIDNFRGSMTQYIDGDINSGLSNIVEVVGADPFQKPGNLTWNEQPEQIDPEGNVITDLIVAAKTRTESGITYVYAIGHTARLYKIQVNDPTTFDPDYDNPVLLATLSSESPTFTRGGFIDFYGATEQIYIGHDKGVTKINFDGSGEAFVGALGSWTQTVPRPLQQFLGNLYAGNGENITEIISAGTVSTYTKLSPGFPSGNQVRDIDLTTDGTYLKMVVTRQALSDITSTATNIQIGSNLNSYIFDWNGTDTGYTAFSTFPNVVLSANKLIGDQQYTFGYDIRGGAIYNPINKLLTSNVVSSFTESPLPNGVVSFDNVVFWMTPLYFDGVLQAIGCAFGSVDFEVGPGYWSLMEQFATGDETDVLRIPNITLVSNFAQGSSSNGYTDNIFSTAKLYFSTLESSSGTTKYKLYKWTVAPAGYGTAIEGIYQTQTQIFSKKVSISEVRVYGEPWVANNSFTIDLIGSAGTPITNGSKTFTVGSNLTAGADYAWYNPGSAPTYAIGVRITNVGSANHTINKIEIDVTPAGK